MPQHDLDIADGSGVAVLADLNSALVALGSHMKGPNAPPAPIAGLMWFEDDNPSSTRWTLKAYDGADWIALGVLDTTTNRFEVASSSFGLSLLWAADAAAARALIGAGALLNVQVFTASGTYTPTSGVSKALIMVKGGGGGGQGTTAGSQGGTTSFGSLVTAEGGYGGGDGSRGGSAATGATWVEPGGPAYPAPAGVTAAGGGRGGGQQGFSPVANSGGGGPGFNSGGAGYGGGEGCTAWRWHTSSPGSQTVTIGAGGAAGSGATPGASGICVVMEYA